MGTRRGRPTVAVVLIRSMWCRESRLGLPAVSGVVAWAVLIRSMWCRESRLGLLDVSAALAGNQNAPCGPASRVWGFRPSRGLSRGRC